MNDSELYVKGKERQVEKSGFLMFSKKLWGKKSCAESLVEEWGIGLSELEEEKTPQENLQSQLTWVHGSQRLNHQPKSIHQLELGPYIVVADVQLGLHEG